MSLIEWNSSLSVGIPSIDEQHKILLAMINDLHTASIEGHGAAVIGQTLAGLVRYTVEHFQYEERLFSQTNYAGAQEHILEHADLVLKVEEINTKFMGGATESLSEETLKFLVTWLMNHTLGSDKDYSAHFIAAGIT